MACFYMLQRKRAMSCHVALTNSNMNICTLIPKALNSTLK